MYKTEDACSLVQFILNKFKSTKEMWCHLWHHNIKKSTTFSPNFCLEKNYGLLVIFNWVTICKFRPNSISFTHILNGTCIRYSRTLCTFILVQYVHSIISLKYSCKLYYFSCLTFLYSNIIVLVVLVFNRVPYFLIKQWF